MSAADDAIAKTVRAQDRDRYVSVLYAPADKRPALFALYAFNAEIASVRDRIRQPIAGEMRLQWWRDVLHTGTVDATAGHPLARALVETIHAYRLPSEALVNMLDARVFDLYDDPMPSRTYLEGYCGETASALIQLTALVLDRDVAPGTAEIAGHAGCAQEIVRLLRLVPLHRTRGQCYVPLDMLGAAGTTAEAFIAGEDSQACARALLAMVTLGREHWNACEQRLAELPAQLRPAFLPSRLTPAYLDSVEQMGAEALRQPSDISRWRRQWLMFRSASRT